MRVPEKRQPVRVFDAVRLLLGIFVRIVALRTENVMTQDPRKSSEPTQPEKDTNPPRSNERPHQTAEVPLGSGGHPEPPGGGGRPSQRVSQTRTSEHPVTPDGESHARRR